MQEVKSVQGYWKDNMWNQYPKHLLEPKVEIEYTEPQPLPLRPYLEKKLKMNKHTQLARSKPKIITRYNEPNPKL